MDTINRDRELLDTLTDSEREVALSILNDLSTKGESKAYQNLIYQDYDEVPVDIATFIHDKRYLGNGLTDPNGRFTLFPYWEEKLAEIFPTNTTTRYNTIILTGAIGLGKSTIAVICLLYMLYRLLCLKDPYAYYGMQPIDKISISLMNITMENAKGVALDKMNQLILSSEWFMSHGYMSGSENLIFHPEKHIEVITASSNNQVIGRCLFANFTDEVNFGLTNDVEKLKRKQKQLISQIDARMASRFQREKVGYTYLPTLNIIASSKNSEQSFLEDYIETKRRNNSSTTLIVDEPQWVVDSRKDSPVKFQVAIGNKFLANELLPLDCPKSLVTEYRARGYQVIDVPIGYREKFEDNLDGSLMDIAGIATQSSTKYISGIRWNEIKTDKYRNPFTQEIIEVGTARDDTAQYSDFFDLSRVPGELRNRPLYIHLDMSKSGDKTGIAGIYIMGKRPSQEGVEESKTMFFRVAFNVSIKAPKGYEISFDKNRTFINWLRDRGFRVKGVSSDTFQAAQIHQQLTADGFDVKTISMDRVDKDTRTQLQYAYLKSTIYERRMDVYSDCSFLTEEVLGLERLSDGSIEHPEQGTQGSKDAIDAVAGALWNASQHSEEYAYDYGENLDMLVDINQDDATAGEQARIQATASYEDELRQALLLANGMDGKDAKQDDGDDFFIL